MDISTTVKGIMILGVDGKRLLAKYFDPKINSSQFEKKIFSRTKSRKNKDEILIEESYMILHRYINDVHLYVFGSRNENPLVLDAVLECIVEAFTVLLHKNVEVRTIFDNLEYLILALDEICDGGTIIETDPKQVVDRVCLPDNANDMSMAQVFQSATEHIKFPWSR